MFESFGGPGQVHFLLQYLLALPMCVEMYILGVIFTNTLTHLFPDLELLAGNGLKHGTALRKTDTFLSRPNGFDNIAALCLILGD